MNDEAMDYLGEDKVLYCSMACLRAAGINLLAYVPGDSYKQDKWGALCPACERPYHGYGAA